MTIRLTAIHIYPVKGLKGISLDESVVTERGLQLDRRFMIVDDSGKFVTQRSVPKMATVCVELEQSEIVLSAPETESITFCAEPESSVEHTVRVWSNTVPAHVVSSSVDDWLSKYLGLAVQLVFMPDSSKRPVDPEFAQEGRTVSFADGYPLLLASEESLHDLNERIVINGGEPVPMSRFRANLIIIGGAAFGEDRLGEIVIGESVFCAVKPCARCKVTTTDQETGEVCGPEPLRTLAQFRGSPDGVLFGMNLIPVRLGGVKVGDLVGYDESE